MISLPALNKREAVIGRWILVSESKLLFSGLSENRLLSDRRRHYAFLFIFQVSGGEGRCGGVKERLEHLWDPSFRRSVSEYQTNRHQRDRPGEISAHAVGEELLYPRLCGPLRPASCR